MSVHSGSGFEISGAFSGASWLLFPARFFQGPVKQLLFQAFGVQPAIAVAEQATRNVAAGYPIQQGLGEAYGKGALGTLAPALGYAGANRFVSGLGLGGAAPPLITGRYRDLSGTLPTGWQANHVNQTAAYQSKLSPREAFTVAMRGNINIPDSQHYLFHQSLERFWDDYRRGGKFEGTMPTNAQYGQAAERALVAAGFSPAQAAKLAAQAAAERAAAGLDETATVPRIPVIIRSIKR